MSKIVAIRTKVMRFTPQKECPMMIKSLLVVYFKIIFHVAEVIWHGMGWHGMGITVGSEPPLL